ncbi:YmdB family metallophosphoesterase [Candidatus Saccharibacteria bacterium]|nr:YmdB family metallophosphoesterase [Candidatus Saccharibacteria bacterium]
MNILYVGDIMAEMGISTVEMLLPGLRNGRDIHLVIAQGENVTAGKGMTPADMRRLQKAGVDFFTGGNHSFDQKDLYPLLADPSQPVIRPENYPIGTPGLGHKYTHTSRGDVLIISLLGQIVGKSSGTLTDNPLKVVDSVLEQEQDTPKIATVINFHGDFSSEKIVIGNYLDGRATIVLGDHWHVPTADARVLPGGTAHMTDVGMCGALDSSLGVTYDSIIPRWRDGIVNRNELATSGARQFNGLLVSVDEQTGLALSAEHIRTIIPA